MARLADNLTNLGLIGLGLVLMATPLALWVAWTETLLLVVLAVGATAAALYCLLIRFQEPDVPAQSGSRGNGRLADLPDKTIEDLQRLHPYIHHHRASGGPKFRRAMYHLKRLLYSRPDR